MTPSDVGHLVGLLMVLIGVVILLFTVYVIQRDGWSARGTAGTIGVLVLTMVYIGSGVVVTLLV